MVKKLILSLSLVSIIAPVHGMWRGLSRGAQALCRVSVRSLRDISWLKDLTLRGDRVEKASPVAAVAFLTSQDTKEMMSQKEKGPLGRALSKCLFDRDGRVIATRSATNALSSGTPYDLGAFNAAIMNGTVKDFMASDRVQEWYKEHCEKYKNSKKISMQQFLNSFIMLNDIAKNFPEVPTLVAAAALSKCEDEQDLKHYLEGLGVEDVSPKKFTRKALEKLTKEPDQAISYLIKRSESDVSSLFIYDQYAGYQGQSEYPICAETSLWTIINFIFYNKATQCFDLSLIPADIAIHPDLKAFLKKYSKPKKDNYIKNAKQAWMDFISGVPILTYCGEKNYELETNAFASLEALKYCFGIESAGSFQEVGNILSTEERTIIFSADDKEKFQTVTVEIIDQDYHLINWKFMEKHVDIDRVEEGLETSLSDSDIATLWNIQKHYPELSIGSLVKNEISQLLLMAVKEQKPTKVTRLIKLGADVNATCENGNTLLFEAVESKNQKIVRFLLKNGADPNVIGFLDRTPLFIAVRNDDQEMVRLLLDNNANPNFFKNEQYSPLAHAAKYRNKPMISLLCEYNAYIDEKSAEGLLEYAFTVENKEFARSLLEYGLNADTLIDKYIKRNESRKLFFLIDAGGCPKNIMRKIVDEKSFEHNYDKIIKVLLGVK